MSSNLPSHSIGELPTRCVACRSFVLRYGSIARMSCTGREAPALDGHNDHERVLVAISPAELMTLRKCVQRADTADENMEALELLARLGRVVGEPGLVRCTKHSTTRDPNEEPCWQCQKDKEQGAIK